MEVSYLYRLINTPNLNILSLKNLLHVNKTTGHRSINFVPERIILLHAIIKQNHIQDSNENNFNIFKIAFYIPFMTAVVSHTYIERDKQKRPT